jgi:hypothetical protein
LQAIADQDGERTERPAGVDPSQRAGHVRPARPVHLAYQPPASGTFLSQQISHQQPASSTLLLKQTSTSHQPPANREPINRRFPASQERSAHRTPLRGAIGPKSPWASSRRIAEEGSAQRRCAVHLPAVACSGRLNLSPPVVGLRGRGRGCGGVADSPDTEHVGSTWGRSRREPWRRGDGLMVNRHMPTPPPAARPSIHPPLTPLFSAPARASPGRGTRARGRRAPFQRGGAITKQPAVRPRGRSRPIHLLLRGRRADIFSDSPARITRRACERRHRVVGAVETAVLGRQAGTRCAVRVRPSTV